MGYKLVEKCSLKTLYNYIHKKYIKYTGINFSFYVKAEKSNKEGKSIQKGDNIKEQPIEAKKRLEFGHFEGDLIVGPKNTSKECLFTLTDRMTRLELAFKIPNKSTKSIVNVIDYIESIVGQERFINLFKSITFDNGTEFKDVTGTELSLNKRVKRLKTYFADAYSSWQRGSNENANLQLRRFFPKGTNFEQVSDKAIMNAVNKINYNKHKTVNQESIIDYLEKTNGTVINTISLLGIQIPFLDISRYLVFN